MTTFINTHLQEDFTTEKYYFYLHSSDYCITSEGNLISFKTDTPRKLKLHVDKDGYLLTNVSIKGKPRTVSVARELLKAYYNSPLTGYQVDHIDGNRQNNHISNLQVLTIRENNIKAHQQGPKRNLKPINLSIRNTESGETRSFKSLGEASQALSISTQQLSNLHKGIRKSTNGWVLA